MSLYFDCNQSWDGTNEHVHPRTNGQSWEMYRLLGTRRNQDLTFTRPNQPYAAVLSQCWLARCAFVQSEGRLVAACSSRLCGSLRGVQQCTAGFEHRVARHGWGKVHQRAVSRLGGQNALIQRQW